MNLLDAGGAISSVGDKNTCGSRSQILHVALFCSVTTNIGLPVGIYSNSLLGTAAYDVESSNKPSASNKRCKSSERGTLPGHSLTHPFSVKSDFNDRIMSLSSFVCCFFF